MLYLLLICSYRAFAVMTLTFSPQPSKSLNIMSYTSLYPLVYLTLNDVQLPM